MVGGLGSGKEGERSTTMKKQTTNRKGCAVMLQLKCCRGVVVVVEGGAPAGSKGFRKKAKNWRRK